MLRIGARCASRLAQAQRRVIHGGMADLTHMALPGAIFTLRVTPGARRNDITLHDGVLRVHVTAPPADGKANKAVLKLLAKALGVAPSRLTLIRGQTGRDKLVRLDQPASDSSR